MSQLERDKQSKEFGYGGFLTTYVKEGDYLFIGDSLLIIKEIKNSGVILCIRAPKNIVIKKSGD